MRKVYCIEFIEYTDYAKETVSHNTDSNYIHTHGEPFLIFEDDIEHYKNYGKGIKSLTFVGNMKD